MRQLSFVRPGPVEWRDVVAPRQQSATDALVRPLAVGRCDLDAGYVRGLAPLPSEAAIGHEMIGEVVEVGDAVRITPGTRVIVSAQIACKLCRMCRRGHSGRCESVPFAASFGMGREGDFGGLACDLVRVPFADAMLFPIAADADPVALIGCADMALDAWRAVGPQLAERPGARVLVMGGAAQVIGLYAAGLARTLGAGEVVYADADAARRAQAERQGARAIEPDAITGQFGIVVEASGDAARLLQAVRAAEPEGLVTSVAIHFGATTPLPLQEMYWKGITYRTGRPNVREAVAPVLAACAHGFHPHAVAQSVFAFEDAPEAWMSDALRTAVTGPVA
jgi:alcohol dehydrogenase